MIENGDYISREAAIEILTEPITMSMCLSASECRDKIAQREMDLSLIKSLPAADVRPVQRGKWKYGMEYIPGNPYGHYECSECHAWFASDFIFCPNCGAMMEES